MACLQVAADVQAVAAEVVAGAHMQDWAELRQRQAGAPAVEGEAAPAGTPEGELCIRHSQSKMRAVMHSCVALLFSNKPFCCLFRAGRPV